MKNHPISVLLCLLLFWKVQPPTQIWINLKTKTAGPHKSFILVSIHAKMQVGLVARQQDVQRCS